MEKIFKEREVEIQLKNYFQYMEKFYGEEFAIKTTLTNYSIQQALSFFSKRFDNFEDSDIYSALLRRCILCNGKNVYVEYANDLIAENRIEELLEDKPDDLDEQEEEMFASLESLLEILKI